jgi:Fe-S cluster biosynthesis and repair protein YggX
MFSLEPQAGPYLFLPSHALQSFDDSRLYPSCCEIIFKLGKVMAEHKVFCVKLQQELPGLDEPPFDTDLGKKVYDNVSKQAWGMWTEHCKMLLNEYRLNPARKEDQQAIVQQLEQFFFGQGSTLPKEYVPPAPK